MATRFCKIGSTKRQWRVWANYFTIQYSWRTPLKLKMKSVSYITGKEYNSLTNWPKCYFCLPDRRRNNCCNPFKRVYNCDPKYFPAASFSQGFLSFSIPYSIICGSFEIFIILYLTLESRLYKESLIKLLTSLDYYHKL